MNVFLLLLALTGHVFFWVGWINRLHGIPIPRRRIKRITWWLFALMGFFALVIVWWILGRSDTRPWRFGSDSTLLGIAIQCYVGLCCVVAPLTIFRLIGLCLLHRLPSIVRFRGKQDIALDLEGAAAHERELEHHALVQLPFNEILQLEISRWTIDVPRLPPSLDGLTIAHLSDLHFTERVGKAFFREVVEVSNRLDPDLVCITGDLIDRETCFDWIPDTFGKLRSRYGVYFVLGNHDLYVDWKRLRSLLTQNGLIDLGGRWLPIEIRGAALALAGNERPWFTSEALDSPPPNMAKIVLAHTPDQFAWARRNDVDLMLAGHTHGGQIRIPPFGAIFTPCVAGVRYISGFYYVPPTIMHISRGLSGDIPVRWNCRPEISLLKLRSLLPQCNESRIAGRTL